MAGFDGQVAVVTGASRGIGREIARRLAGDGATVVCTDVMDLDETDTGMPTGPARALCRPTSDTESWGMAEFIAAEEMGRYRGHWWSRDGEHLLVARVEESPVATWWIGDPAHPDREPRPIRYPAAGTANAKVDLWLIGAGPGESRPARQIEWDTERFEYLASVRWDRHGALVSVQSRDQRTVSHLAIDLTDEGAVSVTRVAEVTDQVWVELEPGGPRRDHGGRLVAVAADPATDSTRVRAGEDWLSPPDWQVRSVLDLDDEGVWVHASRDPAENHVCRITWEGVLTPLTTGSAWHTAHCVRPVRVITTHRADTDEVVCRIDGPDAAQQNTVLAGAAEPPAVPITTELLPADGAVRVAVTLPAMPGPRPVIVSSYAGPHAQRVICAARSFATERWFAALGYVVVTIDGRGVPGVAPSVERAVHGDLSTALDDQVAGLRMAADAFPGRLDTGRVGIRGWSFGGYLAALAVLRRPDVFHAGLAGAPVTDWALYDTHYTERYLGTPRDHPRAYRVSSIVDEAASLTRPLLLVHGIADDNVVAAHTLRLSTALLAAGRPHEVLPLVGVTHMTPQAAVNENLLRAEVAYFERALAHPA